MSIDYRYTDHVKAALQQGYLVLTRRLRSIDLVHSQQLPFGPTAPSRRQRRYSAMRSQRPMEPRLLNV
jgi:hypothetical protein